MELILVIIAILVVIALSGYAYYLHRQLKQRDQQRAKWKRELEELVEERTDRISNSIMVIASATLEEQVSLSESCLRLSALLNQLGSGIDHEPFQVLHKAAAELEHIPIQDAWKALKFKQRMVYIKEMERVEATYGDFVRESCRLIVQQGVNPVVSQSSTNGVGFYQP